MTGDGATARLDMSIGAIVQRHTPYQMSGREWGDETLEYVWYCPECCSLAGWCEVRVLRERIGALESELDAARRRAEAREIALEYTRSKMEAGYQTGNPEWDEWYEIVRDALRESWSKPAF